MRMRSTWVAIVTMALATLVFMAPTPGRAGAPSESEAEPRWSADQRTHWSLVPPTRPTIPDVSDRRRGWIRNPIDAFILHEIEELGLAPAPEADRLTLIRRLRFDLTGLPPSPAEVDAFLADHPSRRL